MGWDPCDERWWPEIAEALVKPWPREAVMMDLRWWASRIRRGVSCRPGRRLLEARWGWSDWQTRAVLKSEDEWGDPAFQPTSLPDPSRSPPTRIPVSGEKAALDRVAPPASLPLPSHDQPTSLPTRVVDTEHRTPTPTPESNSTPPADEPIPKWAREGWAKPPPGVSRIDVVALVVRCKAAVDATTPNPERCKTDAKPLLSLWAADGHRPPEEFIADFVLVAEAARECPEPLFARDVRAVGWAGGVDRHGDIATLCRHERWSARVKAARAWDAAGRPSGTNGHAVAASTPNAPRAYETIAQQAARLGLFGTKDPPVEVDAPPDMFEHPGGPRGK